MKSIQFQTETSDMLAFICVSNRGGVEDIENDGDHRECYAVSQGKMLRTIK